MARFSAGTKFENTFYRRFARSLLAGLLTAIKDELILIHGRKECAPKCVLTPGKAGALLSWLKEPGKQCHAGKSISVAKDAFLFEVVDALAEVVADWDETALEAGQFNLEMPESPLARYNKMVSNPYVTRVRDLETWKTLFDVALHRAAWANTFKRLQAMSPGETWRLAPHATALHLASRHAPKGTSLQSGDIAKWLQEQNNAIKEEQMKLILELTDKSKERASGIKEPWDALQLAGDLARETLGGGVPETYLASQSDVAATNVALELTKALPKPSTMPSDYTELLDQATPVGGWVLQTLLAKLNDEVEFEVYFPVALRPVGSFHCGALETSLVEKIPEWCVRKTGAWSEECKLFLLVKVKALTAELARRFAAQKLDVLFDTLFGLDGLKPVIRKYDPEFALAIDLTNQKGRTWGPRLPGLPETRAQKADVEKNSGALLRLGKDPRPWCRQLSRTLHILRLAGESKDIETRFVHGWRALESVVGHLSAELAEPFRFELIGLARCYWSKEFGNEKDPAKLKAIFDREMTEVHSNLDPVKDIRNKWAMHTGDERIGALDEIDFETLEDACDWIEQEVSQLFQILVEVALNEPALASRKDVHTYLSRRLLTDLPPTVEAAPAG